MYKNSTLDETGFLSNPFESKSGADDKSFTILLVARTQQAAGDTGDMGILRLSEGASTAGEGGMFVAKSCSTCITAGGTAPNCFQGKYGKLSTLNAGYGTTPAAAALSGDQLDENHCAAECASGCDLNNIPAACKARWGPSGSQNLQDPDKSFRIVAVRATPTPADTSKVKLSVFIDGFHASSQPPMYITGSAGGGETAPSVAHMLLGVKSMNNGTLAQYLRGDIAEMLVYDAALTNAELDRLGNYVSSKYALPYMRLDKDWKSASRTVPLSCSSCIGPGPIGEGGLLQDGGVTEDECYDARGLVGSVYSESMFNLSTGAAIQDHVLNGFQDMYITVCSGACAEDSSTGIVNNKRGTAKILASSARHDGLMGVNVTLKTKITGVAFGDGSSSS